MAGADGSDPSLAAVRRPRAIIRAQAAGARARRRRRLRYAAISDAIAMRARRPPAMLRDARARAVVVVGTTAAVQGSTVPLLLPQRAYAFARRVQPRKTESRQTNSSMQQQTAGCGWAVACSSSIAD
jgi:hypothetical protein